MAGRRAQTPLPAEPWTGAETTARAESVELPGVFGRRQVGCVRFEDGSAFLADDVRAAVQGRATILETLRGEPLAFLFRADAPSPGSALAPLSGDADPSSWLLAQATGHDGAVFLSAVLTPPELTALGAWLDGA